MDDKKVGWLSISLKKSETLTISDGVETIEITISDRFKQPLHARVRIKATRKYEVKRRKVGGEA